MKKVLVIVLLFAVLFAAVSVAFADTETVTAAEPESKEEYYTAIDELLAKIKEALLKGDREEAEKLLEELRKTVYKCAIFLAEQGEYDLRILQVVAEVEEVFKEEKTEEEIEKALTKANDFSAEVLLGVPAEDVVEPEAKHS
ncbi:MAG: hypothetical protein IJI07_11385 [Flexilinea sp.]|nr:hypothetical protein [Flexilinea sp.]